MNKELADGLRHMQNNPTTGTAHNQHVISTQVETIFAVDELNKQIGKLIKTIETNDSQGKKLEQSNLSLQRTMLVLTFITTVIALFPVLKFVATNIISPVISKLPNVSVTSEMFIFLSSVVPAILATIIGFLTSKYQKQLVDTIKISDNVNVVLKDKWGRIKEIRNN